MCWSSQLPTSLTSNCVAADWPRNVQHAAWSPAYQHCGWSDNVQLQQPLTDWRIATVQTSYQSLLIGLIPSSERASQTDRQNNPPHWFDAWLLALHFLLYNVCCLRGGPFKGSAANGPMGWDSPRTVGGGMWHWTRLAAIDYIATRRPPPVVHFSAAGQRCACGPSIVRGRSAAAADRTR